MADNHDSGSYNKWVASGQDQNYLPHWLNKAGYRTECEFETKKDNFLQYATKTLQISAR